MSQPDTALDRIVTEQAGFVRALALRLAPAPGLAEDIAQQVFLEFLSKPEKWDLSRDVRPLLAGMTRNVARREWREKTHDMPDTVRELAEHIRELAEAREVQWFEGEEKSALRNCLDKLPDKSRKLIELHYYLDLTSVDIAGQMAMNTDAVRRALFRLRERLRGCIQRLLHEKSA